MRRAIGSIIFFIGLLITMAGLILLILILNGVIYWSNLSLEIIFGPPLVALGYWMSPDIQAAKPQETATVPPSLPGKPSSLLRRITVIALWAILIASLIYFGKI